MGSPGLICNHKHRQRNYRIEQLWKIKTFRLFHMLITMIETAFPTQENAIFKASFVLQSRKLQLSPTGDQEHSMVEMDFRGPSHASLRGWCSLPLFRGYYQIELTSSDEVFQTFQKITISDKAQDPPAQISSRYSHRRRCFRLRIRSDDTNKNTFVSIKIDNGSFTGPTKIRITCICTE